MTHKMQEAHADAAAPGCPATGRMHVKSRRGAEDVTPAAVERDGDTWRIRSHAGLRHVLRSTDVAQAGFNSEAAQGTTLKQPVLFQDGEEHRAQRTAIARFFTPKTVTSEYRALMEELADDAIARLRQEGRGDLSALAMGLAVQVAARVVGLTDSRRPGMDRRLDALLALERLEGASAGRRALASLASWARMLWFYLHDVRPAIAARRAEPREDVISHLLAKGYRPMEILIECITYGAAGMATTREFVCMSAWHLLERDELRERYLAGDEDERHRILHEILRLEPVVGRLYRRATRDIEVQAGGETHRIAAGARIELDVRAANADPGAVGEEPLALHPDRELAPGVHPAAMSFGDGAHRCPGAFIAIQETDIFLRRLLRLDLVVRRPPTLDFNDLIESYEIRGFEVNVASTGS